LLAARGWPDVRVSLGVSRGYGLAFQTAIHRDWGGVDLREFEDAVTHTLRDLMTLDNCLQETPIDETTATPPLPRFKGSVRCRSIYETTCVSLG
jgi:hypothetical protein